MIPTGTYSVKVAYHHLMEKTICNKPLKVKGNRLVIWNF